MTRHHIHTRRQTLAHRRQKEEGWEELAGTARPKLRSTAEATAASTERRTSMTSMGCRLNMASKPQPQL